MDYKNLTEERDFVLNEKVNNLIQRSIFLLVGIEHKNVDPLNRNEYGMTFQKELDMIEERRRLVTEEILRRKYETLKKEIIIVKKTVKLDGDLKRAIAKYLINMFEDLLSEDELKGVFRQGYKIMRG